MITCLLTAANETDPDIFRVSPRRATPVAIRTMEVPFISSGALSRAHYALVRKVELAQTSQQADDYLFEEVIALRDRLSRPGFFSVCTPRPLPVKLSLNVQGHLGPV